MATIRNQIIAALVARLDASGKPSGLTVNRFPVANVLQSTLPHIAVRPSRERTERTTDKLKTYPIRERELSVSLEVRTAVPPGTSPDASLDPFLAWITSAVVTEPTLGGLVKELEEVETEWDAEETSAGFAMARVALSIRYTTNAKNQEMNK